MPWLKLVKDLMVCHARSIVKWSSQLIPRCIGIAGHEPTRAKKSKLSKSSLQPSQVEDVPDSEEDLGLTISV